MREIAFTPWLVVNEPPFVIRAPALVVVVAGTALTLVSVALAELFVKSHRNLKALERVEGELKDVGPRVRELENERNELRNKVKALEMRFGEHKEVRSRMRVQVSERTQRFPQIREREQKPKNHNTVGWDALRIYSKSRGELQAYGLYKGYPKNWSEISERLRKDHPQCSNCNFRKEEGNPLQVHHLNGVPADCRTENLQVLCEVCHKRMHGKSPFHPWKHRSL